MTCPCGQPADAHGRDANQLEMVLAIIRESGPLVRWRGRDGEGYMVPRIYIALHGLVASEVRALAKQYGWQPAEPWGRAK